MFSWDVRNALKNYGKHGVPFEEARLKNDVETIRIISARQASRKECKAYAR